METSLPNRSMFRSLVSLSLPIIGLNILGVLALVVDTAMCARLPNAHLVLTALGFSAQILFLFIVAMMGLTIGTVALVARAHGALEHERVHHITTQAIVCTVLLSLCVALLGNVFADLMLTVLQATKEVRAIALLYLRPMLVGTLFTYLTILFAAILRGVGNTRLPFFIALFTNLLNIFLNYCFILGNLGCPAWGIGGAAFGTILSQALGIVLFVFILKRGAIPNFKLYLLPESLDGVLLRSFVRVGTPAAMDMLILNGSLLSLIGMLGWIDQNAVAAHSIGLRIQSLAFVPGMGIAQASGAMIGQALGAKDPERARDIVRFSLWLCFGVMTVLGIVIILSSHPILYLFQVSPDSQLGKYALTWIFLLGLGMPPVGIYIAYGGMLQGAGETNTSLKINLYSTLLIQIPLSWLFGFPFGWGVFGVWLGFPLSFFVKAFLGYLAYKSERWLTLGSEL